jgi:hypothetical protein
VPPIRSCLEPWSTVLAAAKAVRPKIQYMAFKSEKYDQDKATVTVVFGDGPDIDVLANELRKHTEIFSQVDPGSPRPVKDKGVECDFKITLKPKESSAPEKKEKEEAEPEQPAPKEDAK